MWPDPPSSTFGVLTMGLHLVIAVKRRLYDVQVRCVLSRPKVCAQCTKWCKTCMQHGFGLGSVPNSPVVFLIKSFCSSQCSGYIRALQVLQRSEYRELVLLRGVLVECLVKEYSVTKNDLTACDLVIASTCHLERRADWNS